MGKLRQLIVNITDPEVLRQLEEDYMSNFVDNVDDLEETGDQGMSLFDAEGDIGVSDFKSLTIPDICRLLAIPRVKMANPPPSDSVPPEFWYHFPFFNLFESQLGELPESIPNFSHLTLDQREEALREQLLDLRPRWHQYVAVLAAVKCFLRGQNVILGDGVGVGKTIECLMMMCYVRHLRLITKDKINIPAGECQ